MADTEYTREQAANELFRIAMYGDRGNQALICERIAEVLDAALPSASNLDAQRPSGSRCSPS